VQNFLEEITQGKGIKFFKRHHIENPQNFLKAKPLSLPFSVAFLENFQ